MTKGPAPGADARRRAARAQWSTLAGGVLLPVALRARQSPDDFVKAHGRRATLMTLLVPGVVVVHAILHAAIAGLQWLEAYLAQTYRAPALPYFEPLVSALFVVNAAVMVGEVLACLALAVVDARRATRGDLPLQGLRRRAG